MKKFLRDCSKIKKFYKHYEYKTYSSDIESMPCGLFFLLWMPSDIYAFLYKGLDLSVGGTVSEIYDDNITRTNSSGNKTEDFTTRLTLNLGVKYEGKTRTLDFMGRINRDIFAANHNFNNTSEKLELNFQNELSKLFKKNS